MDLEHPWISYHGYVQTYLPDMSSISLAAGEVVEYHVNVVMTTRSRVTIVLNTNSNIKVYGNTDVTTITPSSIQKGTTSGNVCIHLLC